MVDIFSSNFYIFHNIKASIPLLISSDLLDLDASKFAKSSPILYFYVQFVVHLNLKCNAQSFLRSLSRTEISHLPLSFVENFQSESRFQKPLTSYFIINVKKLYFLNRHYGKRKLYQIQTNGCKVSFLFMFNYTTKNFLVFRIYIDTIFCFYTDSRQQFYLYQHF